MIVVDQASTLYADRALIVYHPPTYYKTFDEDGQQIQNPDGSRTFNPPLAWQSCPITL